VIPKKIEKKTYLTLTKKKTNNQPTLVQTTNHGSFVLEAFNPKFLNSIDQVPNSNPHVG
jgi:hypothetical protein